jgi:hypothetical protein
MQTKGLNVIGLILGATFIIMFMIVLLIFGAVIETSGR